MNRNHTPFEALESRTLMSFTVAGTGLFTPAVTMEQMRIRADFQNLRADFFVDARVLSTDTTGMTADGFEQNTVLRPLAVKLRTDVASFKLTLANDNLIQPTNVIHDEEIVVAELKKIRADASNATAFANDEVQLKADRIQLQTDLVASLTQRLTDREAEYAAVSADANAILTALPHSGANTQLTTVVESWISSANLATIGTILGKISTARTTLINDLTAEQNNV